VSSAYDLALFGRAALQSKAFRTYSTTLRVPFPGRVVAKPTTTAGVATKPPATATATTRATPPGPRLRDATGAVRESYDLSNHNRLLWNYPGTIGVKNGWTDLARRTFIGAAQRGGRTYIVTEMHGLESGTSWRPTAALLDWAFAHGSRARPVGHLVVPGEPLPTATPTPAPTDSAATAVGVPTSAAAALQAAGPLAGVGSAARRDDLTVLGGSVGLVSLAVLSAAGWLRRRRRHVARHRTG
jgi:D-alanyl-D-alanine carboxypeptidase (penicillin-binding protein 5/6)